MVSEEVIVYDSGRIPCDPHAFLNARIHRFCSSEPRSRPSAIYFRIDELNSSRRGVAGTRLVQVVYVCCRVDAPSLKIFYAALVVLRRKRCIQVFDDVLRRRSVPIGDLPQEGQGGDALGIHLCWTDGGTFLKSIEKDLREYSVSARIHKEDSPSILYGQPPQSPLVLVPLVTGEVQV